MANDTKKKFTYYSVLALLVLSTIVIITLKANVRLAAAQGGCTVVVTGDGATFNNGGSNPGGEGTDGGSTPGNGSPGTENPGSGSSGGTGGTSNNSGTGAGGASSC